MAVLGMSVADVVVDGLDSVVQGSGSCRVSHLSVRNCIDSMFSFCRALRAHMLTSTLSSEHWWHAMVTMCAVFLSFRLAPAALSRPGLTCGECGTPRAAVPKGF